MSSMEQLITLNLPSDLLIEILCRWLDLKSVVNLDSAFCNYETRPALLELFSARQCIVDSIVKFQNERVVRWFLLRDVQVSRLQLSQHIPELGKYLLSHSKSVRHVCCLSLEAMNMVAIHFHSLDTLEYRDSTTAPDLRDILRSNLKLQELRLWKVSDFTAEPFKGLHLQKLKVLSLAYCICDDAMLEIIVSTSEVLQRIGVCNCELITDAGVIAVAHHCPQLRLLMLTSLPISDDALDQLTKNCPSLSCLDITANSLVTDQGLHTIAKNLSQLHHISIASCENLTDVSVEHLIKYNALTLRELRANGLPSLRVDVLLALLQKCPHLHTLGLDCDLEAFHADIIPYMCNLQTLFVDSVLSDGPLCMIAQHCKKLEVLAIIYDVMYVAPAPEVNELNDAGIDARVMHGWNELAKFEDRKYTEKGLLALMDGLPLLRKLGVHEKEIQQGLLTPLVQNEWRRQRPNIVFSKDLDDFVTHIIIT